LSDDGAGFARRPVGDHLSGPWYRHAYAGSRPPWPSSVSQRRRPGYGTLPLREIPAQALVPSPLPPSPSPKRRGGADSVCLPLSAWGGGGGGGVNGTVARRARVAEFSSRRALTRRVTRLLQRDSPCWIKYLCLSSALSLLRRRRMARSTLRSGCLALVALVGLSLVQAGEKKAASIDVKDVAVRVSGPYTH